MTKIIKNISWIFFCFSFVLFSCDKEQVYDKTKAVDVFNNKDLIKIDESLKKISIVIPKQKKINYDQINQFETNNLSENLEKKFSIKKNGEISLNKTSQNWFFYSGSKHDNFVFKPIIKDNKIITLDTSGEMTSRDLKTNKILWKNRIFKKSFLKNYRTPKISHYNGKIFAIAGINKIVAVEEKSGAILWSKEISSIPNSTPIANKDSVYFTTTGNKTYALNVDDGDLLWTHSGINRDTEIFGSADPIIEKDFLIVSYSSGEIYAINKNNGEPLWSQELNINKATDSNFYLTDIDATPIIKNKIVYAIGNGGLMMAIDLASGKYIWKKQIASIVDFWIAGDFIFLITNENNLISIYKNTGGIKWIAKIPDYTNQKKMQSKIIYSGLIMAGDKLLISRLDGKLVIASPLDGKIEKTLNIGKKISHSPIVFDNKIYLNTIGKYTIDLVALE